jgi:hypothetical protein
MLSLAAVNLPDCARCIGCMTPRMGRQTMGDLDIRTLPRWLLVTAGALAVAAFVGGQIWDVKGFWVNTASAFTGFAVGALLIGGVLRTWQQKAETEGKKRALTAVKQALGRNMDRITWALLVRYALPEQVRQYQEQRRTQQERRQWSERRHSLQMLGQHLTEALTDFEEPPAEEPMRLRLAERALVGVEKVNPYLDRLADDLLPRRVALDREDLTLQERVIEVQQAVERWQEEALGWSRNIAGVVSAKPWLDTPDALLALREQWGPVLLAVGMSPPMTPAAASLLLAIRREVQAARGLVDELEKLLAHEQQLEEAKQKTERRDQRPPEQQAGHQGD